MKFKYALIVTVFCLLTAASLSAEYYQWIDQEGVKHFTDNIFEIPENQRSGATIYKSIKTDGKAQSGQKTPDKKNLIDPEFLDLKKEALDIEYDSLMNKRDALKMQKESMGEKKYNALASELNMAIEAYQKKTDAYEMLFEKYRKQRGTLF